MITEIIAGATSLSSLGFSVWLAVKLFRAKDSEGDARVAQVEMETHVERKQFEIETLTVALANEKRRTAALEGIVNDANTPIDLGLSPADWRARLSRITQAWGDTAHGVPPNGERDGLPSDAAAEPAEAPAMSPIGDVLR